jgi:ribosomal protein L11 methyltransferase
MDKAQAETRPNIGRGEDLNRSMTSRRRKRAPQTWLASLESSELAARRIADLVTETHDANAVAVALVDAGQGRWRVILHFTRAPDQKALRALMVAAAGAKAGRALTFARVAPKDWIGESLAGLRPVEAGRFVVHGAHDRAQVAPNRIGIEIEAGLAFGTGHHGTTRGCLIALDRIGQAPAKRRLKILDLGTGTGVLAIAAARALRQHILALDIDADAVRVARDNARVNRAAPWIEIFKANGVVSHQVKARAPYDLVFANILLGPLQRLAAPLIKLTAPGGHVILSGLLAHQANAALAAYRRLTLESRITLDGWTTLIMKRGSRKRSYIARQRRDT